MSETGKRDRRKPASVRGSGRVLVNELSMSQPLMQQATAAYMACRSCGVPMLAGTQCRSCGAWCR